MACAAEEEHPDEFEEFRARAYSAGASLREKRERSPHSSCRRTGSRKERGRYASYAVGMTPDHTESVLAARFQEMDMSEDSGFYPSGGEDNTMETLCGIRKTLEHTLAVPETATNFQASPQSRHYRSLSCRRSRKPRELDLSMFSRHRTASMPSRSQLRRPDPEKLRQSYRQRHERDYTFCRVRSFTTHSKGIVNRGDSFKVRKSSSQMSLDSTGSATPRDPTRGRSCSSVSHESIANLSRDSSTEGEGPVYSVLMVGSNGVGKSALTQQFMTSENVGHNDTSIGK